MLAFKMGLLWLLAPADGRSLNSDRDLPGLHWTSCVGRVRLYHTSYIIVHNATSHKMPRMHDARWIIETGCKEPSSWYYNLHWLGSLQQRDQTLIPQTSVNHRRPLYEYACCLIFEIDDQDPLSQLLALRWLYRYLVRFLIALVRRCSVFYPVFS